MSEQGSLQRIPYTPHLDRVGRIFREVMGRKVGEDRHEDVASLESVAPCDQHRGNASVGPGPTWTTLSLAPPPSSKPG